MVLLNGFHLSFPWLGYDVIAVLLIIDSLLTGDVLKGQPDGVIPSSSGKNDGRWRWWCSG